MSWSSTCRPAPATAQLTLVQQVPLAGGVVVTTPQDVATLDVQRGIAHVSTGEHTGPRYRREHELLRLPEVRQT